MSARDDGVPWAMRRTPVFTSLLLSRLLMDVPGGRLDVLHGRHRQDAVAEIEDVAGAPARAFEHIVNRFEDAIERRKQHGWIEVALNAAVVADAFPGLVERYPPVGADDVAPGVADVAQNRSGAHAEMNRRDAKARDAIEDPPRVRKDELAVVGSVQLPD